MKNIHTKKELGQEVQFYHSKGVLTRLKSAPADLHTQIFTHKGTDYSVSRVIVPCESKTWLTKLEKGNNDFYYSVRYDPAKCTFEQALKKAFNQYEAVQPEGLLKKIYEIANNVLYLNDNSDYCSALYEICKEIRPDLDPDFIGVNYIESSEDKCDTDGELT